MRIPDDVFEKFICKQAWQGKAFFASRPTKESNANGSTKFVLEFLDDMWNAEPDDVNISSSDAVVCQFM